jgi:ribonuclease-3
MLELQNILQYRFNNEKLLDKAITHTSINSSVDANYERLEFLGDRVLGMATAALLYKIFPDEPEGNLSRRFVSLVCKETVAEMAVELQLNKFMKVLSTELRENVNVLCDVMEAVIGAIYIDGGIDASIKFIEKHWKNLIKEQVSPPKDAKTALQEWAHHQGFPTPKYSLIERTGSEHEPMFVMQVEVGDKKAKGKGKNKKQAEFMAAKKLLEMV